MPKTDEFNDGRTIREERAYVDLMRSLAEMKTWHEQLVLRTEEIPAEWRRIEESVPVRPPLKTVTLRIDADVAKWFRAMGLGHQRRMSAVLRAYMLATISRVIESRKNRDWKGDPLRGG